MTAASAVLQRVLAAATGTGATRAHEHCGGRRVDGEHGVVEPAGRVRVGALEMGLSR